VTGWPLMDPYIHWFDLAGVAVFAASGALTASRQRMDVIGFALIAIVTGIGGGTLRDLLLGIRPVFWVAEPTPLLLCSGVAVIVFFTAHLVESRYRLLLWADALGLALFAVVGAERALEHGAPTSVALVMGVMSATFGGLVRDVLCNELPLILRPEIYVTAALVGAGTFLAADSLGLDREPALLAGFATGFAVRAAALLFGWTFPVYKPRPGRDYPPDDPVGRR